MPGRQIEQQPGFTGKTNDLLGENDAEQCSMVVWIKDDRRVGGVPHQKKYAETLHDDLTRDATDFKVTHKILGLEDKGKSAVDIHCEYKPNCGAYKPDGEMLVLCFLWGHGIRFMCLDSLVTVIIQFSICLGVTKSCAGLYFWEG